MENTKTNYTRFNRHEVFTSSDRRLVMDMIDEVSDSVVENMLYGLFDGYYYNDLEDKLMESSLPTNLIVDLTKVLDKALLNPTLEN